MNYIIHAMTTEGKKEKFETCSKYVMAEIMSDLIQSTNYRFVALTKEPRTN